MRKLFSYCSATFFFSAAVLTVIFINLSFAGCDYKKQKNHSYADSIFVGDSLAVFSNHISEQGKWENFNDTSQNHYDLAYVENLYERMQLNKARFLVPPRRYESLISHIRKLPVLVITGRQYRNLFTGFDIAGEFNEGKFTGSNTKALILQFGEYLDHKNDKYRFEVIDTMPKGLFTIGMTKEMTRRSLGEPSEIKYKMIHGKKIEEWVYENVYRFDGKKQKLQNKKSVFFSDDKVVLTR